MAWEVSTWDKIMRRETPRRAAVLVRHRVQIAHFWRGTTKLHHTGILFLKCCFLVPCFSQITLPFAEDEFLIRTTMSTVGLLGIYLPAVVATQFLQLSVKVTTAVQRKPSWHAHLRFDVLLQFASTLRLNSEKKKKKRHDEVHLMGFHRFHECKCACWPQH